MKNFYLLLFSYFFAMLLSLTVLCLALNSYAFQDREVSKTTVVDFLPDEATDVRIVGNGWITFNWGGRSFLCKLVADSATITDISQ